MAVTSTGELDTNVKLATSSPLTLTSETVVTLYVFGKTGTHTKHEVIIQVSPDGTNWMDHHMIVRGEGLVTTTVSAAEIRACVLNKEDATSTIDFHLVAK